MMCDHCGGDTPPTVDAAFPRGDGRGLDWQIYWFNAGR